jgi:peptidoglycan/xylan/chitin deacetylase (PgdA/CDA1 family)
VDGAVIDHPLHRPVVLVYHAVGDVDPADDPQMLVTAAGRLEAHVRMLLRRGYRFVTAEELLDAAGGKKPPPRTAVLTFDDGWLDGLTVAAPLLQRLGVRATFYLCPGRFGGEHETVRGSAGRLLDATAAGELLNLGMELGSHTMSHPDLRKLDDGRLEWELAHSKEAIESLTGSSCRTFAYPFGLFDDRVERAVEAAGYELALTWQPGPWRLFATPRLPAPARHGALWLSLNLLGVRRRWHPPPLSLPAKGSR